MFNCFVPAVNNLSVMNHTFSFGTAGGNEHRHTEATGVTGTTPQAPPDSESDRRIQRACKQAIYSWAVEASANPLPEHGPAFRFATKSEIAEECKKAVRGELNDARDALSNVAINVHSYHQFLHSIPSLIVNSLKVTDPAGLARVQDIKDAAQEVLIAFRSPAERFRSLSASDSIRKPSSFS